jgi:hypothetical protein
MKRGLIGTTHECDACGYEVLLGPGHHMDLAVCSACGADFCVQYSGGMFAHCTVKTPGVLIWNDSDELKADDRDNPVEVRGGVFPVPGTDLPDLSRDTCPKCQNVGTLVLGLPKACVCPKCHTGQLRKGGTWIQ